MLNVMYNMLKVMHIMCGWQATWGLTNFSELLIEEVPAQLIQEQRRQTGVQPTALSVPRPLPGAPQGYSVPCAYDILHGPSKQSSRGNLQQTSHQLDKEFKPNLPYEWPEHNWLSHQHCIPGYTITGIWNRCKHLGFKPTTWESQIISELLLQCRTLKLSLR